MVLSLKIPLKQAEKWKKYLIDNSLLDENYRHSKDDKFIYYAITKEFSIIKGDVEFVDYELDKKEFSGTFKENLKHHLDENEFEFLQTAHDVIGTIAILEIPKELEKREKIIAETLLKVNHNIQTVLKKAASHEGVFRTQKMTYLAGMNTKETIHRENGAVMKLNVEDVYFSPRLSNERLRITKLIKPQEEILVMFSGCAPYPLVISKNTDAKKILGIEINPEGHKYGLENIKLNKLKNVDLICGDVNIVVAKLKKENHLLFFDRIIMPLPKTADEFLDAALSLSKKGTIIHFYTFLSEDKFSEATEKIENACKKNGKECGILRIVKCGQHTPRVFRICVDFEIE